MLKAIYSTTMGLVLWQDGHGRPATLDEVEELHAQATLDRVMEDPNRWHVISLAQDEQPMTNPAA